MQENSASGVAEMRGEIDVEVLQETDTTERTTTRTVVTSERPGSPATRARTQRSLGGIPLSGAASPLGDKDNKAAERAAKQAAFEETLELKKKLAVRANAPNPRVG